MMWPFGRSSQRVEYRQSYSDAVVAGILAAAGGGNVLPTTLATVEAAAGLWSRGLASADVTPDGSLALAGIGPDVLAGVGRDLCRRGESVYMIEVTAAGVRLLPASSWAITGGVSPETWRYELTFPLPSGRFVKTSRPSEAVVHFKYATLKNAPWKGVPPLTFAALTGRLAASLENQMADEAGGPVGSILTIPEATNPTEGEDDVDPMAEVRTGIASAKGAPILVETVMGGHGDRGQAPSRDWDAKRFGAAWPEAVADARQDVASTIYAALGIPLSLVTLPADGTGQRVAWQRFVGSTMSPLGRLVSHELRLKLDPLAALTFKALNAADVVSARSRSIGSLVKAGVPVEEARRVVGL